MLICSFIVDHQSGLALGPCMSATQVGATKSDVKMGSYYGRVGGTGDIWKMKQEPEGGAIGAIWLGMVAKLKEKL